jgi:hypothetical protein
MRTTQNSLMTDSSFKVLSLKIQLLISVERIRRARVFLMLQNSTHCLIIGVWVLDCSARIGMLTFIGSLE